MVRSERQNREVAMRNIRIGVVEDDPASCQLVLDYLNRYQQENGEQFTVSVFDDGARIVEKYTPRLRYLTARHRDERNGRHGRGETHPRARRQSRDRVHHRCPAICNQRV